VISLRRTLIGCLAFVLAMSLVGITAAQTGAAPASVTTKAARLSYRPDAVITLCGLSTGCVIDPPPHPWIGNGRFNASGWKQKVAVRMEDGEDVRFWVRVENDGSEADTIKVQGCKGTPRFQVLAVLMGKHKRPKWRPRHITKEFKRGTAAFKLEPKQHKVMTVSIVAPTTAEGVTYQCRMTLTSANDRSVVDTVIAQMTTY
jgi:hypothetical protein